MDPKKRKRREADSFVLTKYHIKKIIRRDGTEVNFRNGLSDYDRPTLRDSHVIDLLSNPDHIDKQKLTRIGLSGCKGITDDSLVFIADNCPQLMRLYASKCNITALPDDFGDKLKHLKELYLNGNNIRTLPASIGNLAGTCTDFYIDDNPLQDPPLGVANQGIEAIKRFNTELNYGYQRSNQQKIVLVGNEGVGKTSLLHALQGRLCPLTMKKDRTIYVDHSKVRIPRVGRSNPDILASFYDCGGQEEYASGQTPFLTGSALYLLAVSAPDAENKESYLRFVTLLLMRAPNAVVQLILTKKDRITDYDELKSIGQDVRASIQERIEDYSKGRKVERGKDHATLRLQSDIIYISVKKDPEVAREIIFRAIAAIADTSDPPLLPTLGQKIPLRWGPLFLLIDELREVGIEEMENRKQEIFDNVKRKDAERNAKDPKELMRDVLKGADTPSKSNEQGNGDDERESSNNNKSIGVYCHITELEKFFNQYYIFLGKEDGAEGIKVEDAVVLLESQGDVFMVGHLVFLNPEVIGELMAKLVDHFLKDRVLKKEPEITTHVKDFVKEIITGNEEVNPHKKLMDGLKKFVQTGEIHHHKILPFLWRDVLPPRIATADDYDSIVRMFVESGVICLGSSSENKKDPVPVVVYRLPSTPPPIDDELWPEACPQGLEQVTIHFEVNGDSVPPSLPPAFAAKLRNIDDGDCIHAWLNGCIIESEVNDEEDMTIRADLMKDSPEFGSDNYLFLAVRATAQVAKNSLVFKQMLDFMEEQKAVNLPGLRYDVTIPCPKCKSKTFEFDWKSGLIASKKSDRVRCDTCGPKKIRLSVPNMHTSVNNKVSDVLLEQRNKAKIMTQLRQPLEKNEIVINGVRIRIPPKVDPSIVKDALEFALHVARNGTGEETKAIGFMIVLASKADYEDPNFGYGRKINKFKGNDVFVKDWEEHSRFLLSSFVQDGAMIIDGKYGRFLGDHYSFELKTQGADQNGGLGYKTASAVGEYGRVAIKCSADDCLSDGVGKGYLKVFSGTKIAIKIPIVLKRD